jgi:hypothetical protein
MIHSFGDQFQFSLFDPGPRSVGGNVEPSPQIDLVLTSSQLSDAHSRTNLLYGNIPTDPVDVEEFASPGFHYLDEGMKNFFGDVRIPSKDSVHFMRSVVSGMKKGTEAWAKNLKHGRAKLPVIAINRGSHNYNPEKFSPPHHPMRRVFSADRTRVKLIWRPVPWLVEYKLTIWSEHKRDAEHAIHQILTRFHPLAEFRVDDGHLVGTVTLRFGSCSDTTEKDVPSEQLAKVKYEITTTAEAWLSLPEQVVPTILSTYGGISTGASFVPWKQIKIG